MKTFLSIFIFLAICWGFIYGLYKLMSMFDDIFLQVLIGIFALSVFMTILILSIPD